MADKTLALTFAKVIIAAAWADGRMTLDEINSLKDLLFRLPQSGKQQGVELTADEWALLDMYIQTPVGPDERARLIAELGAAMRNPRDRQFVFDALDELVQADGSVSDDERAVVDEIKRALEAVDLGLIAQLGRVVRGPVQRRTDAVANAPNREQFFNDFIKNKVYYGVRQKLNAAGDAALVPDDQLRKLSLAGGLMAIVARVNRVVSDDEFAAIVRALEQRWGATHAAATLVAEVATSDFATDLDFYRLTREFFTLTSHDERTRFLDALFDVAEADGPLSLAENDEIRRIVQGLNMTQQNFIEAKLRRTNAAAS